MKSVVLAVAWWQAILSWRRCNSDFGGAGSPVFPEAVLANLSKVKRRYGCNLSEDAYCLSHDKEKADLLSHKRQVAALDSEREVICCYYMVNPKWEADSSWKLHHESWWILWTVAHKTMICVIQIMRSIRDSGYGDKLFSFKLQILWPSTSCVWGSQHFLWYAAFMRVGLACRVEEHFLEL